VEINILDPDSLKDDHLYRLEFESDSVYADDPLPSYRLVDYTNDDTLIDLTAMKSSDQQTTVISGFDLRIVNDDRVEILEDQSVWMSTNTTYFVKPGFDSRYENAYSPKRVFYPADFEITLTEKGQGDISIKATDFSKPLPSNIKIKNLTENIDNIQFIFRDLAQDSLFNMANPDTVKGRVLGDAIFIVVGDSIGKSAASYKNAKICWSVTLMKDTTQTIPDSLEIPPQPGDVLRISTSKPFRTGEYFEFSTKAPGFSGSKAKTGLDDIAVVPNPYVGAVSWETGSATSGRGERKIYFIHLPQKCTIRIYTISGHLVQTLEHDGNIDDGQEAWNLISRDGMNVAFGMYVFHVDAPGVGTKIGKFGIIK
jgi:hypothetical protein